MNTRARILFLAGPLAVSPGNVFVLDLARALRRRGHEVLVVAGDGPLAPRFARNSHQLAVRDITGRFARDLTRLGAVRREVRSRAPDLIHVTEAGLARLGALLARVTRLPFVLTLHRPPGNRGPGLLSPPGAVAVPAAAVREEVAGRRPAWRDRLRILPPGADPARFPASPVAREDHCPVVGTWTSFDPGAGAGDRLAAGRRHLDEGRELHLLLAGPGGPDRALHGEVRRLGLGPHVTITGLPPAFEAVLGTIDVYVQPDRGEGAALAILNALAAGRPVAATGVGSTFGLLAEGETALLVPRRDPEAMARAIRKLLDDRARAEKMGEAGRRLVAERFPASASARAAEEIYRDVLGGKR